MKKQSKLIIAAGVLALAASCNSGTPGAEGMDQAFIDSAVNARVEELRMEMMMQNDSIINVLAQERADSILNAMQSKTSTKKAPKKKVITRDEATMSAGGSTQKVDATKKVDDSKSKWGNGNSGGTDSKSKWGDGNTENKGTDSKSKWGN